MKSKKRYRLGVGVTVFIMSFLFSAESALASDGLVGYWKFDEGSGTLAADSSGTGNNGTLTGSGVSFSNVQVAPITASNPYSVLFSGASGTSVDVAPNSSLNMSTAMTAMAWVYWTGASGDNVVIDKSDHLGGDTPNYRLIVKGDGHLALWNGSSGPQSTGTISANAWHLINFTIDTTTTSFYIDGVLSGTANVGLGATTNYDMLIGRDAIGRYFHGHIDEVRIYNRALTPEEVAGISSGGSGPGVDSTPAGCGTLFNKVGKTTYATKCGVTTVYSVDSTPDIYAAPISSQAASVADATVATTTVAVATTTIQVAVAVVSATAVMPTRYTFSTDLSYRNEGIEVLKLQQFLVEQGFLGVTPNGYFGPATKLALMKYQKQSGIPSTGFLGPVTRAYVNSR